MALPSSLKIEIDKIRFERFSHFSIAQAMNLGAGTIAITVGASSFGREIFRGQTVVATLGDHTVIDGFIDGEEGSHDGVTAGITYNGRDRLGQAIDCSAVHPSGSWKNRTVFQIAEELAAPFKVKVSSNVALGDPLPDFKLEESETVFEAVLRAATMRALLPLDDGAGGLILTQAGEKRATDSLELGVNIRRAEWTISDVDRFQTYTVKGQDTGSDDVDPEVTSQSLATATDGRITLFRPLTILSDEPGDCGAFQVLADWHASVRAARSRKLTVNVRGWFQSDGDLWRHNRLVYTRDELAQVDGDLLIESVVRKGDERGGSETELGLVVPDSYKPEPPKEATEESGDIW